MNNKFLLAAARKAGVRDDAANASEATAPPPVTEAREAPAVRLEVATPSVNVSVDMRQVAQEIAAAIRAAPTREQRQVARWDFKVLRDLDGFVERVQATPTYE